MQKICLSLILFLGLGPMAFAGMWRATNEWDMQWERKYSEWMQSENVNKRIFTSTSSPYYGINADCADASYALRAIFSLENALPFRIVNPSGGRRAFNYLSNDLNKFDYYDTSAQRLVAFINYLGGQVGTEHLSYYDTTPVRISEIKPGMLFTYKIKRLTGKTIRHSYNIKDVTEAGNFDVIYATQAIAKVNGDMMYRKDHMFSNAPHTAWGFKRFKWPHLHRVAMNRYPAEFGYSKEQFSLVKALGARPFFNEVKKTLQVVEEKPQDLIARSLNSICVQAKDRISAVNQALEHNRINGRRCMNYEDYDAYSTPSRDSQLNEAYLSLFYYRKDIENSRRELEVDPVLWRSVIAIEQGASWQNKQELLNFCSINYRQGFTIHLAELYKRMKAGLLSSHPNDGPYQRWGETLRGKTGCKVWY